MTTLGVGSVIAMPGGPSDGYRLVKQRGWGGFANVWEAEAPGGFRVALRIVRSSAERQASEQHAIEVIRGIRHPHLLPIFGAWQEQGVLIIGMELAECSLWERFTAACAEGLCGIPRRELLEYLSGVASAVDFLNAPRHAVGDREDVAIQHRDLKPRNILLFGRCAKLGDFGMVRLLDGSAPSRGGMWTLAYAAPEFFSARTAIQSDQYSLAVTYCHMRGGLLPFRGNAAEVMAGHMFGTPDLSKLPEPERPVVARALAKVPEERWPSCREFVNALSALADRGDSLDRLPDESTSGEDEINIPRLPADLGAHDVSDFELATSQDSISAASTANETLSDFHVPALPAGETSVSDFQLLSRWSGETSVSDFQVASQWSGETSASDFQVLSRWSGETSDVSGSTAALPAEGARAAEGTTSRWGGLIVPCSILLCAAGVVFLALWPRARRPERAPAVAQEVARTRPPAVEKAEVPIRHERPQTTSAPRWVVAKPPAPTEPAAEPVAVAVARAPKPQNKPEPEDRSEKQAQPKQETETRHETPEPSAPELVSKPVETVAEPAPAVVAMRPEPAPVRVPAEAPPDLSRAAYEEGRHHLDRGAYADAIAAFTQALEHNPGHHDALVSRGMAHHLNDRYAEALADYSAVLKKQPDHATARLLRGRIHRALGDLDQALTDLNAAVRLRPEDPAAYADRARVHHLAGSYDQALGDFDAALRLHPDDPALHYRRGLVRYHAGDPRGAIEDFDRALALDPRRTEVYLARSEAYARLGQFSRAAADHDSFDRLVSAADRDAPGRSTPAR